MARYKVITTLTWCFDPSSKDPFNEAREQLKDILNHSPPGEIYDKFSIQMDLSSIKDKHSTKHIKEYDPFYILSLVNGEKYQNFNVNGDTYTVKMHSDRYFVFRENMYCVACNLRGTRMFLDTNSGDSPHFNLYGEEDGKLILMTKDHIVPKSKGGQDVLSNYITMCSICNNLKGNSDISTEQIKELRKLIKNPKFLSKKELNAVVHKTKLNMENKKEVLVYDTTNFINS